MDRNRGNVDRRRFDYNKHYDDYKKLCQRIAWTGNFLIEDDGNEVRRDGTVLGRGRERWFHAYRVLSKEMRPEWNWCAINGFGGTTTVKRVRGE